MKKVLTLILGMMVSSVALAGEIARIEEQNSNRALIYSNEGQELVFTLVQGEVQQEIKRLTFDASAHSLKIKGDTGAYRFNFVRKMARTSGIAYTWCWSEKYEDRHGNRVRDVEPEIVPAVAGVYFFGGGAVISAGLCATAPGVPFLVGILAAPIDGIITLGSQAFNADAIAAKKFAKLLSGQEKKASRRVFNSLIRQVSAL